jgi:hypothetical protein
MEINIFISFAAEDKNKMEALCFALKKIGQPINPLSILKTENPGKLLAEKISEGIQKSQIFLPIITENSISNQWVNQEIGLAYAHNRFFFPIIDIKILSRLKGIINPQIDFFKYESDNTNWRREAHRFRNCYLELIERLKELFIDIKFDAHILPEKVKQGESYTTKVYFKGRVRNAFFDNFVEHIESGFHQWNWDRNTLKNLRGTSPGELHGDVEIKRTYKWSTTNWPIGKYKIYTRLYDHMVPGEKGRIILVEKVHHFEVL